MEPKKDLFARVREAIETNPNITVCYFRTLHNVFVDVKYNGDNNFKKALEELEGELRGADDALFDIAINGVYNKGVQNYTFGELLGMEQSDKNRGVVQRVELRVAPTKGLYLPDELQAFMIGLIPEITPDFVQNFEYQNENLQFGKLGLSEKIGKLKRRVCEECVETITDSTLRSLLSDNILDGQKRKETDREETKEYYRVITLEVFPDVKIAKKLGERHADFISYDDLITSRPEIKQKIDEYIKSLHRRAKEC